MTPEEQVLLDEGVRKYCIQLIHKLKHETLPEAVHVLRQLVDMQDSTTEKLSRPQ